MLVLTRKIRESIVIGDNIVIEILDAAPGKIRIGIAAPTSVRVVRGELLPHKLDEPNLEGDKLEGDKLAGNKMAGSKMAGNKKGSGDSADIRAEIGTEMGTERGEAGGQISDTGVVPERPFPRSNRPLRGKRGKQNTSRSNPSKAGKWDSGRKNEAAQVRSGQVNTGEAEVPRLTAVRTVADIARCRLRQLREQIAARKNASEVAETPAAYRIDSDLADADLVKVGLDNQRYSDADLSDTDDTVLDDAEFFDDDALLGTQLFRESMAFQESVSFRESMSFADESWLEDKMSFEMYWRAEGLIQDPK